MHSSLNRIQAVFGYLTSVAVCVACAIALAGLISPQSPSGELKLRDVQVVKGRPHYYSTRKEEYAHVRFDLDADLTSLFNWNTKQLFVYIVASYPPTSKDPRVPHSEVVVWDAIIPASNAPFHPNTYVHPDPKRKDSGKKPKQKPGASKAWPADGSPGILRLDAQKPKYQITDASGKIADRGNATLSLRWNTQPWVGALTWSQKPGWPLSMGTWGWKDLVGGLDGFDFPALKSAEPKREELKVETGKERNRGKPA